MQINKLFLNFKFFIYFNLDTKAARTKPKYDLDRAGQIQTVGERERCHN